MPKLAMPTIHDLQITREAVFGAAEVEGVALVDRKALLADAAEALAGEGLELIILNGIRACLATHEAIYGEFPGGPGNLPPAQWTDETREWVAELRAALDATFADWRTSRGVQVRVMEGAELWREEDAPLRAEWTAKLLVTDMRNLGDGKFLAACGVTAADYEPLVRDELAMLEAQGATLTESEAALVHPAPPAPPAPPVPPVTDYAPPQSAAHAPPLPPASTAPALPGAAVEQPAASDLAEAFRLLAQGLNYETAELATVAGVSASGLRNWLKGAAPRRFSALQGSALRAEIDTRIDCLRRAADIFGAVLD